MKQCRDVASSRALPWRGNTPEHRWYGLGRYYAMFPPSFAHDAVHGLTGQGECVLDPFCGRGNAPFMATTMQRPSIGIDINPVGWVYTATKLGPAPAEGVLDRLQEISDACRPWDRRSRSRFETMAWAPGVRSFLRAARRELDWRGSAVDRTLMAFVMLHMQDKRGTGLSNALWPTIACSPAYAVKWWTRKGLLRPPDVDPQAVLEEKIKRRYSYGTPKQSHGNALFGDAATVLRRQSCLGVALLLTSPPYCGVTDYWNDHWIRLWMLGHELQKNWRRSARFENQDGYRKLLRDVFRESKRHLVDGAAILVRSDLRRRTAEMCMEVLQEIWPDEAIFMRTTTAPWEGQSIYHGRGGRRAKELDFLLPGERGRKWSAAYGFREVSLVGDYLSTA